MIDLLAIGFYWSVWKSTQVLILIGHVITGHDD
jgi:hypothetical protein